MACKSNVYKISNPLYGNGIGDDEADYGNDLGREVELLDMVRHPMGSLLSAPRDQQSPPLRQPLAALDNSLRVAAVAGASWFQNQVRIRTAIFPILTVRIG